MKNEGHDFTDLAKTDVDKEAKNYEKNFKQERISAKTNNGIRLGMTETQVRNILGKPTKQMWSKKFEARELIYRRRDTWLKSKQDGGGEEGTDWSNYYLFRNGKLYYIEFSQSAIGGA